MIVKEIVPRPKAVRILADSRLYDSADEWVIAEKPLGTLLNLKRRLVPEVTEKLLFGKSNADQKPLFFIKGTKELDRQTLRGVRELTPESAKLLDQIIETTDSFPQGIEIVVTNEMLQKQANNSVKNPNRLKENDTINIEELIKSKQLECSDELIFDPHNIQDATEKTIKSVVQRQGQPEFRKNLIDAYNGQCAFTGTNAEEALEAAHIIGYKGKETNHVSNGLLLRADIHTLFDLNLIAIDPKTMTVIISPTLSNTTYKELSGKKVFLPENKKDMPSLEALELNRQKFR